MIESSVKEELGVDEGWKKLRASLQPFVARRVRGEAAVDDVLQNVFLKIQQGLPKLRDEQRFGAWVYQLTRNAIVDYGRSSSRQPSSRETPPEIADRELAELDERESERALAGTCALLFVSMLASPYREALTLTEVEGLTQVEAAKMLGISLSGMKSRVQRGRQKLRHALEQCCEVELDGRGRVVGFDQRPGKKTDCCD